jgi:hypothetical protein
VPPSTRAEKLKYMQIELEHRRMEATRRMEIARMTAKQRVEMDDQERRRQADLAYRQRLEEDRLRAVDPIW